MKKVICVFASALLLGSGSMYAQGEMDAYKFSQNDLNGTARYMSMGGAFGALGGDISAMHTNPAGLAIYRSSEVVTTLSLSMINTNTNWAGTTMNGDRSKFNFDNIGYVGYFPTGNDEGIIGWNLGFSYNRVKNFNRSYKMSRSGGPSVSNYIADITNLNNVSANDLSDQSPSYDPYASNNWLSTLGYNGGLIDSEDPSQKGGFFSPFGYDENGKWVQSDIKEALLEMNEKGAVDKYNFSFATNISDIVFLGATFNLTDINYSLSSTYDEDFGFFDDSNTKTDHLYLDNNMSTDGTGYSFNVGAIVRPAEFLRLGVAYNSPTWYKMTDYYVGKSGAFIQGGAADGKDYDLWAETPSNMYTEYQLRTPDRWIFSAAGVIGKIALVSVDYELTNYKSMRLHDRNSNPYTEDNDNIQQDFKSGNTLRVGAEVKVTPQFAVRAGGAWASSPLNTEVRNGVVEIYTPGARPNYTVDRGASYYTVGLGYRFTPNFYADLAYVYKEEKEDAYAFSHVVYDGETFLESEPATLKTKTSRVALTLGYKF